MKKVICTICHGKGWIDRKSPIDSMFAESKMCMKCDGNGVISKRD
jgi:DnaJ-class molecular chaperone